MSHAKLQARECTHGLYAAAMSLREGRESLVDTSRRALIVEALALHNDIQADAGEAIGLTRRQMTYWCERFNITTRLSARGATCR